MFLVVDQRHNFYQRSKNALETVWVSYLFFPDVLCLIFVQVSLLIISGLRLRACLYMCARVWICDVWASVSVLWLLYSCDKSLLHSRMEMCQSRAEPWPLSDRVKSLFLVLSLCFDLSLQTISAWTLQDEIVWTAHLLNTKNTELQYL